MSIQIYPNSDIIKQTVAELLKVPYTINDVVLLVNCTDTATGKQFTGSNIINVAVYGFNLDKEQKIIILSQLMKKLEIGLSDILQFGRKHGLGI